MTDNTETNEITVAAKPKKKERMTVRRFLAWLFFPVGLFIVFFRRISWRFKLNITSKTTFIFATMFILAFAGYAVFILATIGGYIGKELTAGFFAMLIIATIAIIVVFSALFISLGVFTSRSMLRPVRKMINKIDNISGENLGARLDPVDSQDELMELTEQINNMLDSIGNAFEQQKYFVSDASHELKTPLSVIHGYAELLKRWGKNDKKILDEAIDAIYAEANNMKQIVEQLLFLTKLGSFNFTAKVFNLSQLIDEVVSGYEMTRSDKLITADVGDNVTIIADRAMVVELIRILTDNAIKYTPDGGRIHLQCYDDGGGAVISVADNGIGIAEKDLPHIYERFYRCDKSRGRESGSTGLGLAIAKSIIDMLGGEINCKSEVGKGTTFTITIPHPEIE